MLLSSTSAVAGGSAWSQDWVKVGAFELMS